jgi:vacuolar-type H+-ATPase subunit I/STV1
VFAADVWLSADLYAHHTTILQGIIDQKEFCREVTDLGVEATKEELDSLFASLDADGSGALQAEEIKGALRQLQELAEKQKASMRSLGLDYVKASKKLKEVQTEYQRQLKAEKVESKRQAAKQREEELEREAAKKLEHEAKLAAAAERKAAAAAQKAAFEAKIAARRGAAAIPIG